MATAPFIFSNKSKQAILVRLVQYNLSLFLFYIKYLNLVSINIKNFIVHCLHLGCYHSLSASGFFIFMFVSFRLFRISLFKIILDAILIQVICSQNDFFWLESSLCNWCFIQPLNMDSFQTRICSALSPTVCTPGGINCFYSQLGWN